jgi:hypothetical protein
LWYSEQATLVEYGIARFTGNPSGSPNQESAKITIEEPLALISVMRYFELNFHTLESNIRRRLQDDKGTALEEAVLLVITKLLQDKRKLSSIFEFYGQSPSWARCTAKIVTRNSSGNYEAFSIDKPINPRSIIAFSANSPEDVTNWLNEGEAGWCIPSRLMGPDLMARLKLSNGKILLLVVQAKCRTTGNIDTVKPEVTVDAIKSLTPERYFGSLVRNQLDLAPDILFTVAQREMDRASDDAQLEVEQRIDSMLDAINQGDRFTGPKYNILRLVAAFPLDVNFKSSSLAVKQVLSQDTHALAKLSRTALMAELAINLDTRSFLNQLNGTLKRSHTQLEEGSDGKAKGDTPKAKRRNVKQTD